MSEKEYVKLIIKTGYFLLAARGILLIILSRKIFSFSNTSAYRKLFWYALFAFMIAIFELSFIKIVTIYKSFFIPILTKTGISDTFFISPIYWLNELIFVGLFFSKLLSNPTGKIVKYIAFTLFFLELINTFFGEGYIDAQPIGSILAPSFEVSLSILLIKEIFNKKINTNLRLNASLIVAWGFLIMNTYSILIYFFTNKLFENNIILYYQISLSRMIVESLGILIIAYGVHLYKPSKNS